jgi:hypothetical protein
MMPPPPPPAQVTDTTASASLSAETLSAALREATGLYDLPHAALERLVGDVVREDGFVRLVSLIILPHFFFLVCHVGVEVDCD